MRPISKNEKCCSIRKSEISGLRDLLEVLEDRSGKRSTLITSQLPIDNWHEYIADPTLADAILDRIVHDAYKSI